MGVGTEKDSSSFSSTMIKGASMMVSGRLIIRLIGLISVSITARLLTPEDFGVMGAASLVLGFFMLFGGIGLGESILRMKTEEINRLHTLFTLRFIIACLIACLIILFAPTMAMLLQEPRIEAVLYLTAMITIILSLHSPAVFILRKRLDFKGEIKLKVMDKILSVSFVLLSILYIDRSYMGMVYGQLMGVTAALLTSQIFYRYRPKFSLIDAKNEAIFSFWTLVRNISNYGSGALDEWAAKRASDTATFGGYHAAHDLNRLMVSEMLHPIGETFAAGLLHDQDRSKKYRSRVVQFFSVIIIMGIPLATGVSLVAEEIIFLLLGYQWHVAVVFMPYIAFAVLAITMSDLMFGVYVVKEKQRNSALLRLIRVACIAGGCFIALLNGGALLIAKVYCGIAVSFLFIEYAYIFRLIRVRRRHLLRMFLRPILSALCMTWVLMTIPFDTEMNLIILTLLKVTIGALTYVSCLYSLWMIAGKPAGGESDIISKIQNIIGKRSG